MEEIVGGLQDEFEVMERAKEVEIIDEKTFIVSGQTPLDEMGDLIGEAIESEDFNTIGGYVFGLFGRLPKVGEQIKTPNFRFLIMELEDRKIAKIKITKL
jgi:CBS domain containing-hemolysin-like protein